MGTVYEIMQHNVQHGIREKGVATLLHPLYNEGQYDTPYAYALRYHETDVVTAYPDGSVKLDSGGYSEPHYAWSTRTKTVSPTTRERINRYMPAGCQVYQSQNKWYVSTPSGRVEFEDGMYIRPDLSTNSVSNLQTFSVGSYEPSLN